MSTVKMIIKKVLLCWCFCTANHAFGSTFSELQLSTLQGLYDNLNGNAWNWNNTESGRWNFSTPSVNPCLDDWQGISCNGDCSDSTSCNIIEINLSGYNLVGSLPEEIENFRLLEILQLSNNGLTGYIPSQIGNLSNLQYLDLSFNNLHGTMPFELGNLTMLLHLSIANTAVGGTIPPELGNLAALQYLDFTQSWITGSIPSAIGNLASLEHLSFAHITSLQGVLAGSAY